MVTPKLSPTPQLARAAALVAALTVLGLLTGLADPRLAGSSPPHPALRGTASEAAAILAHNLRILAAPFALWLLGLPNSRLGRHAGDLIILSVVALSAIPVGLELGRWRGQLIPYLPQLPAEWAALTVATGAWLTARTDTAHPRQLVALAAVATALLLIAASLETWATPHRTAGPPSRSTVNGAGHGPLRPCGPGVVAVTPDDAPGRPRRCKVTRSLPLAVARFRSAASPALPGHTNHPRTPQGGTT